MKYIILATISALLLTACSTTGTKITSVKRGMSKAEVESILGEPDALTAKYNRYKYLNRFTSPYSWNKADYYVDFDKDDKVWEYGSWNFRQSSGASVAPAATNAPAPTSTSCTTYNNGLGQLQTNCDSQ